MDKIYSEVSNYYNGKIKEHGANSKGVDWNGPESHELRFTQLTKIIEEDNFSVLDYGCGYGALVNFLDERFNSFNYTGFDIASEMINAGNLEYSDRNEIMFTGNIENCKPHDYCIASGIFNVKLENPASSWEDYIVDTLDKMNGLSTKGFSFNLLTSYSDKEFMKDYLYYAEPEWFFQHCKINYSKEVALLHDYKLYEFTILVRK